VEEWKIWCTSTREYDSAPKLITTILSLGTTYMYLEVIMLNERQLLYEHSEIWNLKYVIS
jgi:hypothetical protein